MLHQILTVFGPLLAFMLIPLWIPVVTIALGWGADRVFPRPPEPGPCSGRSCRRPHTRRPPTRLQCTVTRAHVGIQGSRYRAYSAAFAANSATT